MDGGRRAALLLAGRVMFFPVRFDPATIERSQQFELRNFIAKSEIAVVIHVHEAKVK